MLESKVVSEKTGLAPLGYYVLVEMDEVEKVSDGGIVLPDNHVSREQDACDFGTVRAIGPTAYIGFAGLDQYADYKDGSMRAAAHWGIRVGDRVEYRRYEGKRSGVEGCSNFRYIPDSHILGKVVGD